MTVLPRCTFCQYSHLPGSVTCSAFPDGIPDEIFQEGLPHAEPYPGDLGIQFLAKPEFASMFREGAANETAAAI